MDEILRVAVDNGLGVLSFLVMIYYIFTDKKQTLKEREDDKEFMMNLVKALDENTDTLKVVNENQKEMTNTLTKINYRLESIEKRNNGE